MKKIRLLKNWISEWKAGDELIVGEHITEMIADRLVRDGDAERVKSGGPKTATRRKVRETAESVKG